MERNLFSQVRMYQDNPKWAQSIKRQKDMYIKAGDIRSVFTRDYNRILHCNAYRRLKHKTQVFFATRNDHICTRIEHVNHVASVSYSLAQFLGLNTELTTAIAIGHDLGHAPFGHTGEGIISRIAQRELGQSFWHEKNSLRFIDKCDTLETPDGKEQNLNLTYAVRDGIICHCGEVDENVLFPREEAIDLNEIQRASELSPFTWEGCIVKISDKISYLGRDIEDALALGILSQSEKTELAKIFNVMLDSNTENINNTFLIHNLTSDLCAHSSPKSGIRFSDKYFHLINAIKDFNYEYIYNHKKLQHYHKYAELILTSIFDVLSEMYEGMNTLHSSTFKENSKRFPMLTGHFSEWLLKFSDINPEDKRAEQYENEILYHLSNKSDYLQAVIDFLSGMTDYFALDIFNELTSF